jgi:hypothetical protein
MMEFQSSEDAAHSLAAQRVIDACAGMPIKGRLVVLETAWLVLAGQARNESLAFPGGFPAERDRQLLHLKNIAALVRGDVPDLELQRLTLEENWEGASQYIVRKLRNDTDKDGAT